MKMNEVKEKAMELGIEPGRMKKSDLVRSIQEAEGNPPSFGNNDGACPYAECCWWDDCVKEYNQNH